MNAPTTEDAALIATIQDLRDLCNIEIQRINRDSGDVQGFAHINPLLKKCDAVFSAADALSRRSKGEGEDELEWRSTGRSDVPSEGLAPCPFCGAANVTLRRWIDARRWVKCRICKMTGPEKLSDSAAVAVWNALAASPAPPAQDALLRQKDAAIERAERALQRIAKPEYGIGFSGLRKLAKRGLAELRAVQGVGNV